MSTRPSMATRARPLTQDQNLHVNNKGVRKALVNITNSEKSSAHLLAKKNHLVGAHRSKSQQKQAPMVRKPLANITNSEKPSSHTALKKSLLTKCTNVEVLILVEEEECLHDHQSCMNLQTTSNMQSVIKMLGVEDDDSPLHLWSPKTPLALSKQKVGLESTPRYLEFTQTPVLKLQSSVRRSMNWSPFSPSIDHEDTWNSLKHLC